MKKKITFLKTLLVAAGLLGSNGAWAEAGDVTTNVDIDFSNAITGTSPYTIEGSVGKMTWTGQWTQTPYVQDGIFYFGNIGGCQVELLNNNIRSKDIVTISFELGFSKVSGKNVGFDLVDTEGNMILSQRFDAYNGDFDDNNPLNLDWASMYRGSNNVLLERVVYFTIELNYANQSIKTNTLWDVLKIN
ncbi:MAG: hypothetical protein IJV06_03585 [Bacteroidaceae bacterium]|nr:hypothetical protein [Bacteroidaceae bacterium]